ncbi:uncharacterized protein LAJ45_09000 [Morchella importuna]|uniref:uncharacterized protein n=1 Tax=Morchella importuna TaxID=1174673 RepID=UPI001E8DB65C|nr:uncharacterized protein LAJ45_09000 [Morchella importuna]KAH8146920.1 hypothetical protein LAJ45_09000 [Morchella importuna]
MTHAHHHVNYREVLVTSLAHSTTSLPTIASDHELNSILLTAACLSDRSQCQYVCRAGAHSFDREIRTLIPYPTLTV